MDDIEKVIVVGSGPAGIRPLCIPRAPISSPLVIEGFAWGGLLQQTTDVENYPASRRRDGARMMG